MNSEVELHSSLELYPIVKDIPNDPTTKTTTVQNNIEFLHLRLNLDGEGYNIELF